jgi:hypothetical protein
MNKNNTTVKRQIINITILAIMIVALLLLIFTTTPNFLNFNSEYFYLLLSPAWVGFMLMTLLLFRKYNPERKLLAETIVGIEFIIGILGSYILGDIVISNGRTGIFIFTLFPCVVGFGILSYSLMKHNRKSS